MSVSVHEREIDLMSNMFQILTLMAVLAAFFATCRYLNLRGDRTVVDARSGIRRDAVESADLAGRRPEGESAMSSRPSDVRA
jgi:hypothetical protein